MVLSVEQFADTLRSCSGVDEVWEHMSRFSKDRGFSKCSLTLASKSTHGLVSDLLVTDLPDEFCNLYQDAGLVKQDPFLLCCCRTLSAKRVSTDDFSTFAGAAPEHQAFLDFTADAGAKNGLGIPVRSEGHSPFGGWLLTSTENNRVFATLQADYLTDIHLAGMLAYEQLSSLLSVGNARNPVLSMRERECLLWLSRGLRPALIAEKLSVSESAINLYVSNAKRKLDAKTREQAIARAIYNGEIRL